VPFRPTRVQPAGNYGAYNPSGKARVSPPPSITQAGPALALVHVPGELGRELHRMQSATRDAVGQARANPMARGVLVEGVAFHASTWTKIAHGLGFAFRGAMVVSPSALASYAVSGNAAYGLVASLDARQCWVQTSADCTASVWVW